MIMFCAISFIVAVFIKEDLRRTHFGRGESATVSASQRKAIDIEKDDLFLKSSDSNGPADRFA